MQDLTRHPNVFWLGHRPHEQIPALGSAFDVAIMPWLRNEWIANCNPIKLKEYLALGLPVVTMPFPEADRFADVIDIASDPDDFVVAVRRRLDAPGSAQDAERRRARVLPDSWDQRAQELLEICESVGRPSCAASRG